MKNRIYLQILCLLLASPLLSQNDNAAGYKGGNIAGIPVLKYNSDEGFGYGVRLSYYNYARGGYNPYYYLVDTQVALTTKGKKELYLFFDSPFLLGEGRRLSAEIRYQDAENTPFYGVGSASENNENLTDDTHPDFISEDYYHFGRRRLTAWVHYQSDFGPVRLLSGLGFAYTRIDQLEGRTLLKETSGLYGYTGGFTNTLKVGVIYDTRDFEPAPTRGDWVDVLYEVAAPPLGSTFHYLHLTVAQRHYQSLPGNLVLAQRLVGVQSWGEMPYYDMAFVPSSFRIEEAVGGSKSVRGLPVNRFLGKTEIFGNLELRWRVVDLRLLGQDLFGAISGFVDFGGAWNKIEQTALKSFQIGKGGGIHIGWDESFIISVDAATGPETSLALYIGVGYLF
ncbi:MAG TPA: BamA/TamA family outer membrane protein [Calditrichia bacterium]|nr:BamA/TamA family outer membrane protein [Calditrichia bacterium]